MLRGVQRAALLLLAAVLRCLARPPNALRESETRQGNLTAHVPLLVLVFTQQQNRQRRSWQRSTWLGARWHLGGNGSGAARRWRYVYVQARRPDSDAARLDRVVGDIVTLSATTESYANLVYKTLE